MSTKLPKKSHRPLQGQGSFNWYPTRQAWVGQIYDQATGKRVQVQSVDEDKAWAKFVQLRKDKEDGVLSPDHARNTRVKDWADIWLDDHQSDVRPKTFATDRGQIKKWVLTAFPNVKIKDLSAHHMRKLASNMRRAGLSATTINYTQNAFKRMMRDALREGYQVPPAFLEAKVSGKATSNREAIPAEDVAKILIQARKEGQEARWVIALLQGLRPAEALGLRWSHVSFEHMALDVSWQLQNIPYEDRKRKIFRVPDGYECEQLHLSFHLTRPKTLSGQRIIPLVPQAARALMEWRAVAPQSPHDLVFPREDGLPMDNREDRDAWTAIVKAAGVAKPDGSPYLLYEARHTTATLLLAAGVSPEVIKQILGHSSIVVQQAYQHVDLVMVRDALDKIGRKVLEA